MIFTPANFIHVEGLHGLRFYSEQRAAKGLQVWDITVAVHDENVQACGKPPVKICGVPSGRNNHNGEVRHDIAPPLKADRNVSHATARRRHALAPRIIDRLGIRGEFFAGTCHFAIRFNRSSNLRQ